MSNAERQLCRASETVKHQPGSVEQVANISSNEAAIIHKEVIAQALFGASSYDPIGYEISITNKDIHSYTTFTTFQQHLLGAMLCLSNSLITSVTPMFLINLPVQVVQLGALYNFLRQVVADYEIEPSYFYLVVDELTVLRNTRPGLKVLKEITALGFKLLIGEVGQAPIHFELLTSGILEGLCFCSSVSCALPYNKTAKSIIASMITLAKGNNLTIFAKHIEQTEVLEQLIQLGVDVLYGNFLSPALPLQQLHTQHIK